MISHSAGCEVALLVQQEEEKTRRLLFNQPTIAMSARSPLKHPPKRTIHMMSEGDFIATPGGWPNPFATAAPEELSKRGATVIQFVDENRSHWRKWSTSMNILKRRIALGRKIPRAFEAHREITEWYHPSQKMRLYSGEESPVEFEGSPGALVLAVANVPQPSPHQVNAGISAEQLKKIRANLQKNQPSPGLGGISLNAVARLPLDPKFVKTATFSVTHQCMLLRLSYGKTVRLPHMDPEVARLCFESVYQRGEKPELSIGTSQFVLPTGKKVLNLHPPGRQPVYYLGGTQSTSLGQAMYLADVVLAKLAYGSSADIRDVAEKIPGFHSLPELYPQKYTEHPRTGRFLGAEARVFLHPSVVQLDWTKSGNSLAYTKTTWAIRFSVSGPAEEAFATFFSLHFDKIIETKMGVPLKILIPYARAVALFRWLKSNGVSFDGTPLSMVKITRAVTPKHTKSITFPGLDDISPKKPTILFGPHGPTRIFPKGGGKTVIKYQKGRVTEVQRHDGAVLEIIRDDVGIPIAVRQKRTLEAAFLLDKEIGPVFADNVDLVSQRNMLRAKMSRKTIVFPDNQWESTVGLIIARFVCEE